MILGLIPARSGSKRLPGKNLRRLAGHPLLAYSIAAAKASGIFSRVVVSSEHDETLALAERHGAVPLARPPSLAMDDSPDIEWVEHALDRLPIGFAFAILRPTSPFRSAETIRRAWRAFRGWQPADSLRAVEPARQHPGKMWHLVGGGYLEPYLPDTVDGQPAHSVPTLRLPPVYAQNASLEIAWTDTVRYYRTITGGRVVAFLTQAYEGFDLNTEDDWSYAEYLVARGVPLPAVAAEAPATHRE